MRQRLGVAQAVSGEVSARGIGVFLDRRIQEGVRSPNADTRYPESPPYEINTTVLGRRGFCRSWDQKSKSKPLTTSFSDMTFAGAGNIPSTSVEWRSSSRTLILGAWDLPLFGEARLNGAVLPKDLSISPCQDGNAPIDEYTKPLRLRSLEDHERQRKPAECETG